MQDYDIEDNTWLRGIWNLSSSVQIDRYRIWTREDKYHISKQPCIILFTNYDVFDDFPKISDPFPKISENFQHVVRRLYEWFRTFFRRLPKIAEEDPKMFRLNIDLLWLTEHWNMANSASLMGQKWYHTCGYHFYPHMYDTIFLDLLPLAKPLQFI